jgi:hypothetical protein
VSRYVDCLIRYGGDGLLREDPKIQKKNLWLKKFCSSNEESFREMLSIGALVY